MEVVGVVVVVVVLPVTLTMAGGQVSYVTEHRYQLLEGRLDVSLVGCCCPPLCAAPGLHSCPPLPYKAVTLGVS